MIYELLGSRFVQTLLVTTAGIILTQLISAKGKLRWSNRHAHVFLLPNAGPNGSQLIVHTKEIWVTNPGRSSVEDVEIVFNWRPQHFEIWDPRAFEPVDHPDGRFAIQVPNLAAKEFFSVSILSVGPGQLPDIVNIRSKDSVAKMIPLLPSRQYPNWFNLLGLVLLILGLATAVYAVLSVVALFADNLPPSAI
ncbi:hypothetical protein ASC97_01275 [Rhizobium sp. Root1203]|uniref:hypothetical protein n=1 Tax=Rhizobium sp. Root1203 TaxID=1736427 RepID=UPI00070E6D8F|nr:hypothetical protein [Rhizobium sp. Root1203]KQV32257.1 hypothetical protein ASC97_01275 [Rhizobium sp. Root1203]